MVTKNGKKMPKNFVCETCDFKCSKKSNYDNHLLTRKHQMVTLSALTALKNAEIFVCVICSKEYKHRSGLSRHMKTCTQTVSHSTEEEDDENNIDGEKPKDMSQLVSSLIDQNKELMNHNIEMIGEVRNLASRPQTINNNQKMTINMYLNDKCAEAVDFMKFIEAIHVSRDQLMYTKEYGLAKGVSNVIIKGLKDMEETARPIHCTDRKRQQFYIKDGDILFKCPQL